MIEETHKKHEPNYHCVYESKWNAKGFDQKRVIESVLRINDWRDSAPLEFIRVIDDDMNEVRRIYLDEMEDILNDGLSSISEFNPHAELERDERIKAEKKDKKERARILAEIREREKSNE